MAPTNASDVILSLGTSDVIIAVNSLTLGTLLGLSGLLCDVISLVVFLRQGLTSSINISFFAMGVSDICNLLTILWRNVCLNPLLRDTSLPLNFNEIKYLTSGWPGGCATRITSWITVYVTAERCLSVATPLKVKEIVTPKKTTLVIAVICLLNAATLAPEYATAYFGWKFYPALNRSLIGLKYRNSQPEMDFLCFSLHAGMAIMAFAAMILVTATLIFQLKRQTRWRRQLPTFPPAKTKTISLKERKIVQLVVAFASAMITFYTPTAIFTVLASSWPDFSVTGREASFYNACWSFAFLSHTINSNVNILLFYKMSSNYRRTINSLFRSSFSKQDDTDYK